jgi:hypothetical protein
LLAITSATALWLAGCYFITPYEDLTGGDHGGADAGGDVDAGPSAGPNLIPNPSFETSTAGWAGFQTSIERVPLGTAPDGAYVCKASLKTGDSISMNDDPPTIGSTILGTTYTATARVASATSASKKAYLNLRERTPGGSFVNEIYGQVVTLNGSFQTLTVSGVPKAPNNTLNVVIEQDSAVAGDALYVDLVTLTASP